jgi:glycosyltransferase involved in cell wall biosynthesis
MQGAQTESRFRGIGRYTLELAKAIALHRGQHEVILALNGAFEETINPLREAFKDILPRDNIRVWHPLLPVNASGHGNAWRAQVSALMREAFLASLRPDVIHIPSLFEGFLDNAVTSIGLIDTRTPVSVTLHDLIPLINAQHYLDPNPIYAVFYKQKLEQLKRASLCMAISESSLREGVELLGLPASAVVKTYEAIDPSFGTVNFSPDKAAELMAKFGISKPFVLYTGGADEHKNLKRLVEAFALLSPEIRVAYQLVLVGKMPEGKVNELHKVCASVALPRSQIIFTSYVADKELIGLYNICKLFVFPSWHEGFGLPLLEAMTCGAPAIAACTTSLPEVRGMDDALFDPTCVKSISHKIEQALTDETFRTRLRDEGLKQAKKFSWPDTATRAIAALEALHQSSRCGQLCLPEGQLIRRHALINAMSTHLTDASDEELKALSKSITQNEANAPLRQFFVDVSELVQRDAATGVQRVVRGYLKQLLNRPPEGFSVEPVYATTQHAYRYAGAFKRKFMGLEPSALESNDVDEPIHFLRGDFFFGLDMQHHVQLANAHFFKQLQCTGVTVKFLVHDLLPILLANHFAHPGAKELHEQWLEMIAQTDGAICVSRSVSDEYRAWVRQECIETNSMFSIDWAHNGADIANSKPSSGVPSNASDLLTKISAQPTFLCVSTLEPRKAQKQLLDAAEILWSRGEKFNLVFVGQQGWMVEQLVDELTTHSQLNEQLFWLKGISDEYLGHVYRHSTCLVAASLGEGFGLSLIEAAQHGTAVLARDLPVFKEVAGAAASYFSGEVPQDLAQAMSAWLVSFKSGNHTQSKDMHWLSWHDSAVHLKKTLLGNCRPRQQLFVDVSELVQRDANTGIQRVVRNVLKRWLSAPVEGFAVEPVYATSTQGYRYARAFTQKFLGNKVNAGQDNAVEYAAGDIFFGLDFQPQIVVAHQAWLDQLRCDGVTVKFLLHDLLCIQMPEFFVPGSDVGFRRWLEVVSRANEVVCVSNTVAIDLKKWVDESDNNLVMRARISSVHNGADLDGPKVGSNSHHQDLDFPLQGISFLMVGTLEPRKGHQQVIDAFDQLWSNGANVNLVIVGKKGWMVDGLVSRLLTHPLRNKRLFWHSGITDQQLAVAYAKSHCLIAASYGEGFGLPLIEAAQKGLPIIARDIEVFREVAGCHARYFKANKPLDLAELIVHWVEEFGQDAHVRSNDMPWLTWDESAALLLKRAKDRS